MSEDNRLMLRELLILNSIIILAKMSQERVGREIIKMYSYYLLL